MADNTNMGVPGTSSQLAGDATTQYAIKRLLKQQKQGTVERPGHVQGPPSLPMKAA